MKAPSAADLARWPHVAALVQSARHVIATAAAADLTAVQIRLKPPAQPLGDIVALMTVGGRVKGILALGLSRALADMLVGRLLGAARGELPPARLHDGVSELLNMIAGNAKALLQNTPYHFDLTLPVTLVGRACHLEYHSAAPRVTICLEIGKHYFTIETALQPVAAAPA